MDEEDDQIIDQNIPNMIDVIPSLPNVAGNTSQDNDDSLLFKPSSNLKSNQDLKRNASNQRKMENNYERTPVSPNPNSMFNSAF